MLQAIRDKVTGWIAYGIIFLISIPFALWGVNSYLGGGELPPAAIVNGEEITARDLDQAYANYRQRLAQMFGGAIPESLGGEARLREQVLDQLIEEFALRQYILDQGYRIGDADLSRVIREMDVFQRDGQFDTEMYESQLRSLGYSPLGFEQELRTSGAMEQLQTGITATAFALPHAKKRFTGLGNQSRKIRTLRYSVDKDSIEVSEDEIVEHYETNAARYHTPERVKIDYIEISLDLIKQGISVSREDAFARYQENIGAYTAAETREASHILIKAAEDQDDAALEKISAIRERIENGEDFAEVAREVSEDPGSAADGGNLGEIERGVMVQTFEAALYSMQAGELSDPVKTGFGWHLIKLHTINGGDSQDFESVRADIEDEIRTEQAESQIFDLVENLANIAYEQSDSLQPAADQLDLVLQTSDWFDRFSGQGIAAEASVRQQAFSPDVLGQGLNSEAIELGGDRMVFIRVNESQPSEQQPLEQVRDTIEAELIAQKQRELNEAAGEKALADLESGMTLDELAQQWSVEVDDHGFVERRQAEIDATVRARAFKMPKPEQGAVFDGLAAGGDFVVIELSAVLSNDSDADSQALDRLVSAQSVAEYQATLKLLGNRADVVKTPVEDLQQAY